MCEFKVNKYITMKLEDNKTNIYINNEKFRQCKFLLLNIPFEKISTFDEIESIDEAAEKLDRSLEERGERIIKIPPEVEFWGHCSNLQVWAETEYDTRILHSNLAFPLLKKLTSIGDPVAKKVFKEEIGKRLINGHISTVLFLIEDGYLDYLTREELSSLFISTNFQLFGKIFDIFKSGTKIDFELFSMADDAYLKIGKHMVYSIEEKMKETFNQGNFEDLYVLLKMIDVLDDSDLISLINNKNLNLIQNIIKIVSHNQIDFYNLSPMFFQGINRLASLKIKNQLKELIRNGDPSEINTAIKLRLFSSLNKEDLREIIKASYKPFLMSLIIFENIGGDDYYNTLIEPIEREIFDFTEKNYPQVSDSLRKIFLKALKKQYLTGLFSYFHKYSILADLLKSKDPDFFVKIRDSLKSKNAWK